MLDLVSLRRQQTRGRQISLLLSVVVALALFLHGCEERPATTKEDVLEYVRNAAVGADVRRLDPAAQAYVDDIFAAYREWQSEVADLVALEDHGEFWELDSANWRDKTAVSERLDRVKSILGDDTATSEHEAKFNATLAAVRNVPPTLNVGPGFEQAVLQRLAPKADDLQAWQNRLNSIASDYRLLLDHVIKYEADFDTEADGLAFQSEDVTSAAKKHWTSLESRLSGIARREASGFQQQLDNIEDELAKLVAAKQSMRSEGIDNVDEMSQLRSLEMEIRYYDALKKAVRDRLDAIQKSKESEEGSPTT